MDDITLPPLKTIGHDISCQMTVAMQDYARAAVIADRKRREKPEAVKVPEKVYGMNFRPFKHPSVRISYTKSGRVWINSEEHRTAAGALRDITAILLQRSWYTLAKNCNAAADLLDGGKR